MRARQNKIPIVFIQHTNKNSLAEGSENWLLHSGDDANDKDLYFIKGHSSLFKEKKIVKAIEDMGIKNLIITGLVTHGCVKSACTDAKKLGYEVTLVKDGHSNYNDNAKKLIDEWNKILSDQGVNVLPATEIL